MIDGVGKKLKFEVDFIIAIPDQDKFDAIIIDEGQDFKELWFELIFSLGS